MQELSQRQNLRPYAYLRPYAFVLGGVMLGGLSPVFTKLLLLQDVEGPTIVAARYLLTVAFLLPFGFPHGKPDADAPRPGRKEWLTLFLVGALGSGLGALLFTKALDLASAGVVNSISKTAPIFVALFAYFTLRERVTHLRFLLVTVMVAASVLIIAGELTFTGNFATSRLLGDLLALGAGLTRAAAELLGKSALRQFRPSTVAMWRFGVGMMVAGTVAFGTGGWTTLFDMNFGGWIILLLLAGVSTALYMALYYRGLSEIPAHVAVSLKLLGAVVTVIVSWFVLAEVLTPYHIAGIAVLISGAYLLVIRSANPQPEEPDEPTLPPRRPWARLRPRLVGLVILLVVMSVGVVWYLSVRHSVQLVQRQMQLTVGEIAAVLVEFGGLEERPSWQSYQQYLQRVVGHRVQGDLYALEVVYLAALDPRGNIGAYAVAPELQVVDAEGRELQVRDRVAMQRLVAEMDERASAHGLITATARLELEGRIVGSLKMGCRREMLRGMVGEIIGRSAVAGIAVVLLAAAIAAVVVGGMVEPIERLTAQLWTMRGSRGAEDETADLGEVELIRRALGVVGQAIGLERSAIAGLTLALARRARIIGPALVEAPTGRAWLAVALPDDAEPEDLALVAEAVAREAARQDGMFAQIGAASALAEWGEEADDALRAVLAARGLADALSRERLQADAVIVIGSEDDGHTWQEAARATLKRTDEPLTILIGQAARRDADRHVTTEPLTGAGTFVRIVRMAEPPELARVAEDPED
ncbi:MAG: EamA family transporter [Armatimonadota bacterium]